MTWLPSLAVALATASGAGCGSAADLDLVEQPWDLAAQAASPLAGDLMPPEDMASDLLQAPGDPGSSGAPKVFYLRYADGKPMPRTSPNPCSGNAPKFVCNFAPTLAECQRQIQQYLDRWYADFNVVFTLTRPTSGSFYTEVISSGGGSWCNAADNVAGIAPFLCDDLAGGVAYTFDGGNSAKETAIIIAQEQAHLVGLEHTLSTRDIMDPTVCPNCDGFENVSNKIQNDQCGRNRQNSYQMMMDRLGPWTGGIKPTPFGCESDAGPPLVQILEPSTGAAVGDTFPLRVQASDDCKISKVTVTVSPMGLSAQSTAAPFEWTLTRISGRQTITVTAFDPSGKQSSSTVTVTAPGGASAGTGGTGGAELPGQGEAPPAGGCDVGGCDMGGRSGGTGLWVFLAVSLSVIATILRNRRPAPGKVTRARVAKRPRR